jgi:hypothetical protein
MDWIEVNGVSLRYELAGSGANTIMLVHEMGGSLETWDDMLPALTKRWRVLRNFREAAGIRPATDEVREPAFGCNGGNRCYGSRPGRRHHGL